MQSNQEHMALNKHILSIVLICCFTFSAFAQQSRVNTNFPDGTVRTISSGDVEVDVVIDQPRVAEADVILCFHGTASTNDKIISAAKQTLEKVKSITQRQDILFISVAYPEEGLLMGDQIPASELALLWVKQSASSELNIKIRKIFLVGHSQGGYVVIWLNSIHKTDGVIANAPGPIDLCFRCELEEKRSQSGYGKVCQLMFDKYGAASTNPEPYQRRSLLAVTQTQLSSLLIVQGMRDSRIQMRNWPLLKKGLNACKGCAPVQLLEVADAGHGALFMDEGAQKAYQAMIGM